MRKFVRLYGFKYGCLLISYVKLFMLFDEI